MSRSPLQPSSRSSSPTPPPQGFRMVLASSPVHTSDPSSSKSTTATSTSGSFHPKTDRSHSEPPPNLEYTPDPEPPRTTALEQQLLTMRMITVSQHVADCTAAHYLGTGDCCCGRRKGVDEASDYWTSDAEETGEEEQTQRERVQQQAS
jgi:hypothetical protein